MDKWDIVIVDAPKGSRVSTHNRRKGYVTSSCESWVSVSMLDGEQEPLLLWVDEIEKIAENDRVALIKELEERCGNRCNAENNPCIDKKIILGMQGIRRQENG